MDRHDLIRQRAHAIWESEGRPDNRSEEHWKMASAEIEAETAQADAPSPLGQDEAEPSPAPSGSKPAKAAKNTVVKAGQKTATKAKSSSTDPRPAAKGRSKAQTSPMASELQNDPAAAPSGTQAAKSPPKRGARRATKS